MSEHTTLELMQALYEVLPANQQPIINPKARALLSRIVGINISKERYNEIRSGLIDQGLIEIGMGHGGTIARTKEIPPDSIATPIQITSEINLYKPTIEYIEKVFRDHEGLIEENFIIEDTSAGGPATGKWERPDITLISSRYYKYTNHRSIDIYSFEVKTQSSCDLTAVYEAHEQGLQTHYPYVVWSIPIGEPDKTKLTQMIDSAQRNEVGLILLRNRLEDSEIIVSATRRNPKHATIERFIEDRISSASQQAIADWHKGEN